MSTALGWSADGCRCSTAVAVSFGGNAFATAQPAPPGEGPTGAAVTGNADAVSLSAHGAATATAASGAGFAAPSVTAPALTGNSTTTPDAPQLAAALDALVTGLLADDAGPDALGGAWPGENAAADGAVSVQVAMTGTAGGGCPTGTRCAVALGISIGGHGYAGLSPAAPCAADSGGATALAVAVTGDAHADARVGAGGLCATGTAGAGPLVAIAGGTGPALGISVALRGAATSTAGSGSLGDAASRLTGASPASAVVAKSGTSGDSVSIALGNRGASSDATSGNSGDAAATCSACAGAQDGLARAVSGDTGLSYSLAGAGLVATASSASGDTGAARAVARGTSGTGATNTGSYRGGRVDGHSGDTGDALAAAVDPSTWVRVETDTGTTGLVVSVIRGPSIGRGTGNGKNGGGTSGGSTVHPSGPGHRRISSGSGTGSISVTTVGAASAGTSSSSVGGSTSSIARPDRRPAARTITPTKDGPVAPSTATVLHLTAEPAAAARQESLPRNSSSTTTTRASLAIGAAVLLGLGLLAAASRLRRGRPRG